MANAFLPLQAGSGGLSIDPTSLVVGIVAGVAAGLIASYLVFFMKPRSPKVQVVQRDEVTGQTKRKSVTVEELDNSKREMRTLILERDLLSGALNKIYEAESDGRITREEREMIARRYSSQIREIEAKLRDTELVVEVGELEGLRDDLMSLFTQKIQNIESRLDQARERLQPMREQVRPEPRVPPTTRAAAAPSIASSPPAALSPSDDLERVVERRVSARKEESEGEKRVNALRDEVMEALAKLEQIDTKKEEEAA